MPTPARPPRHRAAALGAAAFLLPSALPATAAAETAAAPGDAVIWSLSGENATVFLAGSVHLLREGDLPVPAGYDKVYEKASEIVFEIDMAELLNPATAMRMLQLGSLPPEESLADRIGPETLERLRSYLSERGMPAALFDRFTPGMVYLTVASLEAMRQGARPDLGMESQYYRRSLEDGKPSRGLETPEFQMALFDELPPETMEALLNQTLDELETAAETLDELISAWKKGDIEALAELVGQNIDEESEFRELLLTARNRDWIPDIEESLAGEGAVLYLVGAAHLVGPGSVIELLEERGHRPELLRPAD